MIIYLYVKQHSITGLKYFGKTVSKDPFKYLGSGKYWVPHIKKHGKQYIKTLEVWGFDNQEMCTEFALNFSKENNIVESNEWANLCEENGIGFTLTEIQKIKIAKASKGNKNGMFGKTHTDEVKSILAEKATNRFKGKSYEELYGEEKAKRLKFKRSEIAKMKNNTGQHNPMLGSKHKEESKKLQSYRAKNRPKLECSYCGIICASSQFNRWHGDKCKSR